MTAATSTTTNLPERLGDVCVGVRADIDFSRHVFRDEVAYLLLDPMTFQSHALTIEEYEILVRLRDDRKLSRVFESLVEEEILTRDREEEFYEFVVTLHQFGFLSLPIANDRALYRRFEQKRKRRRRELLFAFISWRWPLVNPDRFLERRGHLARPLFSLPFMAIWCVLLIAAGYMIIQRSDRFVEMLPTLIEGRNLFYMWIILIGLKVIHEFGHGYACKLYGGDVPEMGAYFILMTPCAYVNATSAWKFPSRTQRLVVGLGGMYFESIIAGIAAIVWSATDASLFNSLAYQTMFVASLTTIGFNINPLMRFDGYYILSDLLEMPNLRSRSTAYIQSRLVHLITGATPTPIPATRFMHGVFIIYGLAAYLYRLVLMTSISLLLIAKFAFVGLAMAGLYVGTQLLHFVRKVASFIGRSDLPPLVRARALIAAAVILLAVPGFMVAVPLPGWVTLTGAVEPEVLRIETAPSSGVVREVAIEPGDRIRPDDRLAQLESQDAEAAYHEAIADLRDASIRLRDALAKDSSSSLVVRPEATFRAHEVAERLDRVERLTIRAEASGVVLDAVGVESVGSLMQAGDRIAVIGAGRSIARFHISEKAILRVQPAPGQTVKYRLAHDLSRTHIGRILAVKRIAARSSTEHDALDVDPDAAPEADEDPSRESMEEPRFEIVIQLEAHEEMDHPLVGATVYARLPTRYESLAARVRRGGIRFLQWIRMN